MANTWTARVVAFGLVLACPVVMGAASYEDDVKMASGFRASGQTMTLPFVMVREYPFVPAVVNGVPGKLMLDTGAPEALVLNDHLVPLKHQTPAGSSFYGSGQHYDEHMNAVIDDVRLDGGPSFKTIKRVPSHDSRQLEHITPDFLGWIGYGFFQDYAMKLDYRARTATFYRDEPGSVARYLAGEQVLARLPFETRRRPDDPVVHARLGGDAFVAAFDTGQWGSIYTSADTVRRLEARGAIRRTAAGPDGSAYDLAGLELGGFDVGATPKVEVSTAPFPPAAGMGLTEPNIITIGYGVLSRYKTVWDFPNKVIYFLKP